MCAGEPLAERLSNMSAVIISFDITDGTLADKLGHIVEQTELPIKIRSQPEKAVYARAPIDVSIAQLANGRPYVKVTICEFCVSFGVPDERNGQPMKPYAHNQDDKIRTCSVSCRC